MPYPSSPERPSHTAPPGMGDVKPARRVSPGAEDPAALSTTHRPRLHLADRPGGGGKGRSDLWTFADSSQDPSYIACSVDETIMSPNSELMIHDAWGVCVGDSADMAKISATLDQLSDNIASMYSAKAGGTVKHWRTKMLAETWYTADEAVAAGLADTVADPANTNTNARAKSARNRMALNRMALAALDQAKLDALPLKP